MSICFLGLQYHNNISFQMECDFGFHLSTISKIHKIVLYYIYYYVVSIKELKMNFPMETALTERST